MRKAIVLLAVMAAAGCARDGYVTTAYKAYTACLDARGVEGCSVEKAKLDAALGVADAESRHNASRPPLVLRGYDPPPAQPVYAPRQTLNCTTYGPNTTCY